MPSPKAGGKVRCANSERVVSRALLEWYSTAARDLPWRRTRDPYAVWLSEVMCQQTRVETVVPYYERFVRRFPDVVALASAPLDDVLLHWSGLGYYRRARQLHVAAQEVVERWHGSLPSSAVELTKLPGVGAYTAGAIASIAYDEPAPIVDGNVKRVLMRVFGLRGAAEAPSTLRDLWTRAAGLVAEAPVGSRGALNQAMMELGAVVCVPKSPSCSICPLERACAARAQGAEKSIPPPKPSRARPVMRFVAAVLYFEGEVLLAKRSGDGLFGGLWEPPMIEAPSVTAAVERLGLASVVPRFRLRGRVEHALTHRVLEVRVAAAQARAQPDRGCAAALLRACEHYTEARFVGRHRLGDEAALSSLARRVLACARV